MRARLLIATVTCLALIGVPAAASHTSTGECDAEAGSELLTADGFELTFEAPAATAPEFSNPPANHPRVTAQRSAHFYFHTELAPFTRATAVFQLAWDEPSDYDLFLFDADGIELGRSVDENLTSGHLLETIRMPIRHCQSLHLAMRSWAGAPVQDVRLSILVSDLADEDAELEPREGEPRFLYLGGDRPGQLAMAHGRPNEAPVPITSALVEERPVGGTPNQYTRPAVGFNDYRNALQAHFTTPVSDPTPIAGDAAVQVWVSSETMAMEGEDEGELHIRFFIDGGEVPGSPVKVPGSQINPWPTLLTAVYPDLDRTASTNLTVQVSAEPVRSTQGHEEPIGNAHYTVWYDSVQFPSRLQLP